ncbi:hypothetical protein ANCDUO_08245 [Ancylostoma duodenale]|uniref:Reverse transcriptase domain-containing protein n=1 Tax=Ancylostoma duodenale TaxID=51022 RepID=A0A0C2GJV8_9BILA|nr:hypothetical protein ANCDUO_08245 [Ancylostoma duodenale]
MVDDVNEDYTHLVGTIVKIRHECLAAAPNHVTRRISSSTRALLEKRRHMDRQANQAEYAILSRLCRQRLTDDHANFVTSRLLGAAHSKRSLKMEKRAGRTSSFDPMFESPRWFALFFSTRNGEHYGKLLLCSLQVRFWPNYCSPGEEVSPFLTSEVRRAIEAMPQGRAPGADGITVELPQACGPMLYTALARRFSHYLAKCEVPVAWKQSSTILLFKKGDKEDLENYRPITLLPVLYKVFTRCILTRIRRTLDEA